MPAILIEPAILKRTIKDMESCSVQPAILPFLYDLLEMLGKDCRAIVETTIIAACCPRCLSENVKNLSLVDTSHIGTSITGVKYRCKDCESEFLI